MLKKTSLMKTTIILRFAAQTEEIVDLHAKLYRSLLIFRGNLFRARSSTKFHLAFFCVHTNSVALWQLVT